MKKLGLTLVMAMMAVMLAAGGAWAVPINLLNNGSFEDGSTVAVTGYRVSSAADNWNQWTNSNSLIVTELITNGAYSGVGVIDDSSAFHIVTTGGTWEGAYTYNSYHNPGWDDTGRELTFSAWVYTVSGTMALNIGSNQTGFSRAASTTIGSWEFLSVTGAGGSGIINDELLLYSQGGPANFIVDSAWLNYGSRTENPSAPVPEPGTMALLGIGLLGLAFVGRRKLKIEE